METYLVRVNATDLHSGTLLIKYKIFIQKGQKLVLEHFDSI